jgi:hypothetical protein
MAIMNIVRAKRMMNYLPLEISILISGNHGIGKSAIVKQVAKTRGIPCIDFRLSQNDVSDLKGMPFHVNGRTIFALPEFFPIKQEDADELKKLLNLTEDISLGRYGDSGILFLDEINRAPREVQQAAFELVLDRRLNLRSLPPGWRVIAAINGDDSIYNVNEMEPAFLSRFCLIDLQPTYQEWLIWAENEGEIHESIVQFIRKNPSLLDPTIELLKEASLQGVVKVHDRRAWDMFSKSLKKFEVEFLNGNIPYKPLGKSEESLEELLLLSHSFVGNIASGKFKAFVEFDYDALDANIILNQFSNEVAKRVESIVDKGCVPELAAYNDLLVAYIKKNIKNRLSDKQNINLTEYIALIPKEMIGDLWQKFNLECKEISDAWYTHDRANGKKTSKLIMGALVSPNVKKKEHESVAA